MAEEELVRVDDAGGSTSTCTGLGWDAVDGTQSVRMGTVGEASWDRSPGAGERMEAAGSSRAGIHSLGRWPWASNVWRRTEKTRETAYPGRDGGGGVLERAVCCEEVQELESAGSLGMRIRFPTSGCSEGGGPYQHG